MINDQSLKKISWLLAALSLTVNIGARATDISTDPLNTYSAPSSTDVKPNVFFVLDDSGSMDWDFMPDWACASYSTQNSSCSSTGQDPSSDRAEYLFKNAAYNGVYYNPAITYKPPVAVDNTGATNTTTYPSMTGISAATGANTSFTTPNWMAVKNDAYGVQSTSTTDLLSNTSRPPYFFTTVAGEYCDSASLRNCITSNTPSGAYTFPAKVRWCDSSALSNCRAAFSSTFSYARSPSPSIATITAGGSSPSSTSVSGITVSGGRQIMAGATGSSSTTRTVAQDIVDQINLCTVQITGNCQLAGYHASRSGSVVTIVAPSAATDTPVVTKGNGGSMSFAATAFSAGSVPGQNLPTVITPDNNSYPYPGTAAKASTRTDCAGTTCTYVEEMTNYANWWTYYRTRMQLMKSAASNAFSTIDTATDIANSVSRFRLGFMSINNNTGSDFLNLDEFKQTQKYNWYTKLMSAAPSNSTPLRAALSTAGQLYAGKLNGSRLNGVTVSDPLQYSCQQNYTILSTDGFWNEGSGYTKMDGSTNVGNQDASLPRPYYDGGTAQTQTRTRALQAQQGTLIQRTYNSSRRRWGSWSTVTSCTPSSTVQCDYSWGTWSPVSSCTVNYSSGSGTWSISTGTNCQYGTPTSWSTVSSCTPVAQSVGPNYTVSTARECQSVASGGTSNTLADVAAYYYSTDLRNSDATQGTGTCTGPIIAPATTPNDLCADNVPANGRDAATSQHMTTFTLGLGSQGQMIYAPNDGTDYWNDTSGDFYDVLKGTSANSSTGVCSWQNSGACNWPTPSSNSNANIDDLWHAAINGHGTYFSATDAVSLANSLTHTLSSIINTPRPGTAAAAASSNPNVSASDNYVFSSSYKSVEWYGELIRQQITASGALTGQNWSAMKLLDCATTPWTPSTTYVVGNVFRQGSACYSVTNEYVSGAAFDSSAGGVDLSNTVVVHADETATPKVAVTAPTSRTIYTKSGTGLIAFDWATLVTAGLDSYFTKPYIGYVSATSGLSQFCSSGGTCLSATAQSNNTIATNGAAGEALVNFLRGDRTYENTYFRKRTHVLGDIVSAEARYVQAPLYNYTDVNYGAFKTAKASRSGAVYVGANDGMLHAFDATTGKELWAYIPSMVLPNIYKLADKNYSTQHQYFVDGTPETGDICPNAPLTTCTGSQWKTILVGGLNRGGKGYYALDVTDPANPALLWEFTDPDLGFSYSNPKIVKLADGTWVVIIGSGYNNTGVGRLYVLNANTGALIRTISTGTGSAASPSGMTRISAHVLQPMTDNTVTAVYGGDTFGNLWRFDVNNNIGAAGYDAHLLVSFKDSHGNAQPVTIKPVEATINGKPVIYVGTGRYLGTTDVADTSIQTFYAVKDNLDDTTYGNPRTTGSGFVQQTFTAGTCPDGAPTTVCTPGQVVRTSSANAVDWSSQNGWYVDFLTGGERASSDPSLALGTLLFTTITPQGSSVSACGSDSTNTSASFVYALDYLTGGAVAGSEGVSGISAGAGLVTRPVMIEQADGTVRALIRTSGGFSSGGSGNDTDLGSTIVITPPIKPSSGSATRRVSWRELTTK